MKSILELKGKGKGKKCYLFGSGTSLNCFNFNNIEVHSIRIAVNFAYLVPVRIDYLVYSDLYFKKFLDEFNFSKNIAIIGNSQNISDRTNYYFDIKILEEGLHTGFYALQIAQIMQFEEINLAGFDYYYDNDKLHFYQENMHPESQRMYKKVLDKGLNVRDFNRINWNANIYNCNPKSKLKKFNFKEV